MEDIWNNLITKELNKTLNKNNVFLCNNTINQLLFLKKVQSKKKSPVSLTYRGFIIIFYEDYFTESMCAIKSSTLLE